LIDGQKFQNQFYLFRF